MRRLFLFFFAGTTSNGLYTGGGLEPCFGCADKISHIYLCSTFFDLSFHCVVEKETRLCFHLGCDHVSGFSSFKRWALHKKSKERVGAAGASVYGHGYH